MAAKETPLHISIVNFLRVALPREAVLHHSPNEFFGGDEKAKGRNVRMAAIRMARAKKMGMRVGWVDIEVLYGGKFVGLEVKLPGETPTDAQDETHAAIKLAGCDVFVVHSMIEAQMALELCGIPLSSRVAA